MSYTPKNMNMEISVGEPSRQMHSIEKTVQFGSLKNSSSQLNDSVQLANRAPVKGCTEIKAAASQNGKYAYSNPTQVRLFLHLVSLKRFLTLCLFVSIFFHIQFDENGNTLPTLSSSLPTSLHSKAGKHSKRVNKAERNTKNVLAEQIEGHRGKEAIETLVAFIENTETSKKPNIINVNKNVINSDRNAKKKNAAATKKENTKLKKSTSMEELKSSSKIEEEIAQSERAQAQQVSLRQKQMSQKRTSDTKSSSSQQPSTSAASQQSNKRGERRSWGTEELSSGQNVDILLTTGQSVNIRLTSNSASNHDCNSKTKKVDGVATSTTTMKQASVESIPTTFEASEFHVVTKKKRAKKRQILEDEACARQQQGMHQTPSQAHNPRNNGNSHFANSYGHNNSNARNYHQSNNYNDRDVYLNSLTTKDNRRKSTSSVPPSDKSDSSDLDSIRSLPIETTARTSYADIARTANNATEKATPPAVSAASVVVANTTVAATVDRWPSVSSSSSTPAAATNTHLKSTSAADNLLSPIEKSTGDGEKAVCAQTAAAILQKSLRVPLPVEKSPSIAVNEDNSSTNSGSSSSSSAKRTQVVSGATPKHSDVLKTPVHLIETSKNQLQKSKSVDSDKYSSMSMDQFPGLEKTIKPQKSHQNFASIATVVAATAATPPATTTPTICAALPSNPPSQQRQQAQPKVQSKKTPPQIVDASAKRQSIQNDVPLTVVDHIDPNRSKTSPAQQQNSNVSYGGAEETTANSESNFFTPISASSTTKKVKKSTTASNTQHNHVPNAGATTRNSNNNNNNNGAHRPAVIIFNDNETTNENVSPLLFGDFNDDILQLMKQDDHPQEQQTGGTSSSLHSPSGHIGKIVNSTAFDHIDPSTKANQTITSPQSDPGYSSAHSRNTFSTESLAAGAAAGSVATATVTPTSADIQNSQQMVVVVNHQLCTATNSTHTEFSSKQMPTENNNINNKKNIIINKRNTLNNNNSSSNDNLNNNINKTSDVASNQSITNLGVIKFSVQSNSDSDKYNNVKNSTTIDDNVNNNSSSCSVVVFAGTDDDTNSNNAGNKLRVNNLNQMHTTNAAVATATAATIGATIAVAATVAPASIKYNCASKSATIDNSSQMKDISGQVKTAVSKRDKSISSVSVQGSTNIVCAKDVHVRYVDPPSTISNGANFNHEKIVNFVGSGECSIIMHFSMSWPVHISPYILFS